MLSIEMKVLTYSKREIAHGQISKKYPSQHTGHRVMEALNAWE